MSIGPTSPSRKPPDLEKIAPSLRDPRRPLVKWSFLLFAAIIMLNLNGVVATGARVGQAFTLVLFALSVAVLVGAGVVPRRDLGAVGLAYFAFLVAYVAIGSLVNTFHSGQGVYAQHLWMLSAGGLTVYVSAVACRHLLLSSSQGSTLFWLSLVSMAAVGSVFVGIVWPELYKYLPRLVESRHGGFFLNPNDAGVVANIAATFCLARMLGGGRWLPYLAAVLLCGVAVIMTFSRTAMVIYVVLLAGTLLIATSKTRDAKAGLRRFLTVAAAVVAVCVFGWFLLRGVKMLGELQSGQKKRIETFTNLAQGREVDDALNNRLPVFKLGVKYWLDSPLIGHGLGVGTAMKISPNNDKGAHNTWLLILVDSGILPAVLFALFGVVWLREAWRCELPAVRAVALGYFLVFWLAVLTSHNTLTKRAENIALGAVIGLVAGDRELRRRRRLLLAHEAKMRQAPPPAADTHELSHATVAGH